MPSIGKLSKVVKSLVLRVFAVGFKLNLNAAQIQTPEGVISQCKEKWKQNNTTEEKIKAEN